MSENKKKIKFLIVDTSAFIQNAPLQDVAENILTCQEVVDEISNKRQLRRLVMLPYDLKIKTVFPENIKIVTDFAKKTGDYPSLSATDLKVIALTYQIEKEKVGVDHLRTEPLYQRSVNIITERKKSSEINPNIAGFFVPKNNIDATEQNSNEDKSDERTDTVERFSEVQLNELNDKFDNLDTNSLDGEYILRKSEIESSPETSEGDYSDSDDNEGWITPHNIKEVKNQIHDETIEDTDVKVACITTDFAMQNVLKQFNLKVAALDGKLIKQIRTFILRCYTCFKTTSIMTKQFCPKCGNNTLKKVGVSLNENGKMQIHINARRPLTGRGKKFSLPRIKGGKHPNNPILVEDQPMADNRPSRLARKKNNPLDDDFITGFSPFIVRDVNSKSAQLQIRSGRDIKHWMRKNPNEARRKRK